MKIFASLLLIISLASLASAQPYTMYSVAGLHQTGTNVYTATVNVVPNPKSKAPIPADGTTLIITTTNCVHVPSNDETGIVSDGPLGKSLLFTSGATCKVTIIGLGAR